MAVKPIPQGYHSVTPYLIVKGAAKAIEFYKKAFGATEIMRFPGPNDTIAHAEIKIGDSPVMLADEGQASGYRAPDVHGGAPVSLMVYVENVDKVFDQAVSNGAKSVRPVADQFYGDRNARFEDPFGNEWSVTTHVKDVSAREMKRAMAEMGGVG